MKEFLMNWIIAFIIFEASCYISRLIQDVLGVEKTKKKTNKIRQHFNVLVISAIPFFRYVMVILILITPFILKGQENREN